MEVHWYVQKTQVQRVLPQMMAACRVALNSRKGRGPLLGTAFSTPTSREWWDYGHCKTSCTGLTTTYESGEGVGKLCEQGRVNEAVEALGVLVQTDCGICHSLFYTVLRRCMLQKDLVLGRRVHALIVEQGYESDTFLCNHILRMYAFQARLQEAMDVFSLVVKPDAFMWSSMMSAHVKHGQAKEAIELYHQMRRSSVKPDGHVFVAALQACARRGDLRAGQQVHADVLASGGEPHLCVCNGLVDMYAKCGSLDDAQKLFDGLCQKDVVTWNAIIAGYSQQSMLQEALRLYRAMEEEGTVAPDSVTYVCLLQACASVDAPALETGKQLHAQIRERGLQANVFVANSLVNMYAKCGSLEEAQRVFDELGKKDVVTWTALIAGYSGQGMGQEALHLYSAMQEEGIAVPNAVTFVALLQACSSVGTPALDQGKKLHAQIGQRGLQADVFVANSLVHMYAKCGSLDDAQHVFDGLDHKDVVTWTALLTGYSQQGLGREALHLFAAMQEEGIAVPNAVTYLSLLQACASVGTPALETGKQLHAQIRQQGVQGNVLVANSLVNMYAKCGSLEDAETLFDGLPQKDVVTWNAMIAGYSQQGMGKEALRLYHAMQDDGIVAPDSVTFVCVLQACASLGTPALEKGKQLHAQIAQRGLEEADLFVANSLVNMYAKCGSLEDAQRVFDGLVQKDMVTWAALVAGYSQHGMGQEALHLYNTMQDEGIAVPDSATFASLLQSCASVGIPALEMGKQLHAQIGERGLEADAGLGGGLVNMYVKCGSLAQAQFVFDKMSEKNVVTWTTLISGYSQQGMGQEALRLHRTMQEEGLSAPDAIAYACLLQACASVGSSALEAGKQLHAQIRDQGFQADVFVANSLINMYAKCGSIENARCVFDGLEEKNVVTWNGMVAGYSQQGMGQEALDLHRAMQQEGTPDSVTFASLLQACASVGTPAFLKGKQLHAHIRQAELQDDAFVASSLINMYAKCGSLEDAEDVFNKLANKTVSTWSAMIAAYSTHSRSQEALRLYKSMQEGGTVAPDTVTFLCLLQACGNTADLHLGRELHAQISQQGLQSDILVASSLINMYGKAGSMADAQQVFSALEERSDAAWNALIAGYTRQGSSTEVFTSFHRMLNDGIQPAGITFLNILTACSHSGLVQLGQEYFHAMTSLYNVTPTVEHYTCMADLLGRAGHLQSAFTLISSMPVPPSPASWRALLSGCQKWSDVEMGRRAFDAAVELDEKDAAAYALMANIYRSAHMWEQAQEVQARRLGAGAWKPPGQSWWTDMAGELHTFSAGGWKVEQVGVGVG